jgi:FKBP-type peptidyl-prolyl cis-trans isomerase FkpA
MRLLLILIGSLLFMSKAAGKDSTTYYQLPDSLRAVSFIADVNISDKGKKNVYAGIGTKHVKLLLKNQKKKNKITFQFPLSAQVIAKGLDVKIYKDEVEWVFNWELNSNYKLLILSAVDTVEKFAIYSGYIYLPLQQKWKLIGTCKINDQPLQLTEPFAIKSTGKKSNIDIYFSNEMVQTAAGPWKRLDNSLEPLPSPPVPPLINLDSVEQFKVDKDLIENKTTTAKQNIEGVYYNIIEPGDGQSFTINDSITVRYQLRIFGTSEVISGNESDTYTFMLKNLIKAWQVAVPLVKTGGKIQLVIPSGLAYSIRTRAPKIPPNSILEFDIEVLDVK